MTHEHETPDSADSVAPTIPSADQDTTVEAIMTQDVVTVSMDVPLHQIQRIFDREGFHHLLVVDEDELVGLISDRDLLSAISPYVNTPSELRRDEKTMHRRAHQIMSRRLITITRCTPVAQAAAFLLQNKIGCLPVVAPANTHGACVASHLQLISAGHTIEGIVTWRDVLAYYLNLEAA